MCAAIAQAKVVKTKPSANLGPFAVFADPATDVPVARLTDPRNPSWLPAARNGFVSLRERFLVFSAERDGKAVPCRLDLRTGATVQIAEAEALATDSLWLDEKHKVVLFRDGETVGEANLSTHKQRPVAEGVETFAPGPGGALFVIRGGRLEMGAGGKSLADGAQGPCVPRPNGEGCLFVRPGDAEGERQFWLARPDGAPVLVAKGPVSEPFWSPDGQSLLFLRQVPVGSTGVTSEIRSVRPEGGGAEQCIAPTSQFAAFAPNRDASVFVGASRSKAQPEVMLLLRSVRREMTLCEHRSSKAAAVSPVFSPDSRRVYFQSDHEGKSALYAVNVETLVEPTSGG